MLIGLLGYAGAGKDTVASLLPGFERRAFADKLRELALRIEPLLQMPEYLPGYYTQQCPPAKLNDLVERDGWDATKRNIPEARRLLQNLGQGAREVLWDTIWIDAVLPGNVVEYDALDIAVTDVRYPNEGERVVSLGGRLWVVERPGVGMVNNHTSERYMDWIGRLPHVVIVNDAPLEALRVAVPEILRYERLRTNAAPLVRYSVQHVYEHLKEAS